MSAHVIEKRKPCIGGCGTMVLHRYGDECRKCRRARIHAGARHVRKMQGPPKHGPAPAPRKWTRGPRRDQRWAPAKMPMIADLFPLAGVFFKKEGAK